MTTVAELDEIIDRAFMDAYDIDEQSIGLATVVTDGIEPPFVASVIGVEPTTQGRSRTPGASAAIVQRGPAK